MGWVEMIREGQTPITFGDYPNAIQRCDRCDKAELAKHGHYLRDEMGTAHLWFCDPCSKAVGDVRGTTTD